MSQDATHGRVVWPRAALLAVLAVAAVLRFWGLGQGLPFPNARPDERELLAHTARFAAGDWNPHWFVYPNLYFYLVFAWEQACLALRRLWLPTPAYSEMLRTALPTLIFYGRLLSATVGTLTVALCYAVGRRLGGPALGLVAALVLATNYLHVRDSHMLKNEILLPAGVLVSLWALAAWVARPGWGRAVGAGVAIGVATGLMYTGILLLVPAWVAGGLVGERRGLGRLVPHPHVLVVTGAAAVTLLLTCPYLLLDPGGAGSMAAFGTWAVYGMREGRADAGWTETLATFVRHRAFGYHLAVSLRHGCGLVMALATPLALALAWRPPRRPLAVLAATFAIGCYLATGAARVHLARYFLPLTPVLALLVAELVLAAAARRALIAAILAVIVVAEPLTTSVAYDRVAARTDTRVLATAWMAEHLPSGAAVVRLGSVFFPIADPELPPGVREVTLGPRDADLARLGVTHVVTHSHHQLLQFSQPNPLLLRALAPRLRLLAEFSPYHDGPAGVFEEEDAYYVPFYDFRGVARPGPVVRVYAYEPTP